MKQEELFNKWKDVGKKIELSGNIIQNNLELYPPSHGQIIEWQQQLLETVNEFNELIDRTHELLVESQLKQAEIACDG